MSYLEKYGRIPASTIQALRNYEDYGISPGGFLSALLQDNLIEAAKLADQTSLNTLGAVVDYMFNEMDHECYGSKEKYQEWRASGGAIRREKHLKQDSVRYF